MRIFFFILLFCFAFAPRAFSNSLLQWDGVREKEWSGYYGGLLFGGQFGHSIDKTRPFGYNANNDSWSYTQSGLNVGFDLGYNYAWRGIYVGPEIEMGSLSLHGSGIQPASPGGDTVGKTSSDLYTALRARLGVDVNHYLLFLTGGALGVNYTAQVIDSCNIAPCGGATINATRKSYAWGYTVGGGVEHMIAKNWSLQLEYLYFNLDKQTVNGTTNLGIPYSWTGQTSGNIVRGGVSYYFN